MMTCAPVLTSKATGLMWVEPVTEGPCALPGQGVFEQSVLSTVGAGASLMPSRKATGNYTSLTTLVGLW